VIEQTKVQRLRERVAGLFWAIGNRIAGVHPECGLLSRDGGYYCGLDEGHRGDCAFPAERSEG